MSGLSGEDRARLDGLLEMADRLASIGGFPREQVEALTRALVLIDQQEKALDDYRNTIGHLSKARMADQLEKALEAADEAISRIERLGMTGFLSRDGAQRQIIDEYRSVRAAEFDYEQEDGR